MKKRIWIAVLAGFLTVFSLYIGINLYAIISGSSDLYTIEETTKEKHGEFDAILVLGAGVRQDASPSNMLEDRLLTALSLYEAGVCDTVIVSGDHGREEYDEVNVMKSYLIEKGVPSEKIFMDHAGFSTYDSICRAKKVFGAEKLIVVTQKYHAYRALMIGRMLGVKCEGVIAPVLTGTYSVYPKQGWYSFRESIARCKDFFYSAAHVDPKFLGNRISLKGSGDVTNDR